VTGKTLRWTTCVSPGARTIRHWHCFWRVAWPASPRARVGVLAHGSPGLTLHRRLWKKNRCRIASGLHFSAPIMKRQRLVSQGSLLVLFTRRRGMRDRLSETIAVLERAGRLDPANPNHFSRLGRAYGLATTTLRRTDAWKRLFGSPRKDAGPGGSRPSLPGVRASPMATVSWRVVQHDERAVEHRDSGRIVRRHHRTAEADVLIERA